MSLLALVGSLGFLVGVLVGVVADDVYEMLKSRKPREKRMDSAIVRWFRTNSLVLIVVVFAASQALLGVLLIQQRASYADYVRCMSNWQTQQASSYSARVDAAKVVSEAFDRLMNAVAAQDADEFHAALNHYIEVRTKQKAAQEANPLPEPPQEACGVNGK